MTGDRLKLQKFVQFTNISEGASSCHLSLVTCHLSLVTCHLSLVTCHLSLVTCHLSLVTCHLSLVTCHLVTLSPCHLVTPSPLHPFIPSRRRSGVHRLGLLIQSSRRRDSLLNHLLIGAGAKVGLDGVGHQQQMSLIQRLVHLI